MVGFERKSCSPRFLDLLLYKLHARFAGLGVFGEEVQRQGGKPFVCYRYIFGIKLIYTAKSVDVRTRAHILGAKNSLTGIYICEFGGMLE